MYIYVRDEERVIERERVFASAAAAAAIGGLVVIMPFLKSHPSFSPQIHK